MISRGDHSANTVLAFAFGVLLGHQLDWFSIVVLGLTVIGLMFVILAAVGIAVSIGGDSL